MAGFGWMGRVHAQAYARVLHHFPELTVARAGKHLEAYRFLRSIAEGTSHGTTLRDAVRSAATLDAMAQSVETGTWVKVATT